MTPTLSLVEIQRELLDSWGIVAGMGELQRLDLIGIAVPDLSGRYHARDVPRFAAALRGEPIDTDLIER